MDKRVTTIFSEIPVGRYEIASLENVMTPALAIYMDIVDSNIRTTLQLLGGDPGRWRPHVKTAKLAAVMERMVASGISNFKCATTLELLTGCESGAKDILVAYPCLGARASRVLQIASLFPQVRVSVLVEGKEDIAAWRGGKIGAFIDVNPGMNRTGIAADQPEKIVSLAKSILQADMPFRGLHYYDGHRQEPDLAERNRLAFEGYDQLLRIVAALRNEGIEVEEAITSGTPAFPCALRYPAFQNAQFIHRVSPGTVVYGDMTSLSQLPPEWGYQPAAVVIATIVSHPEENLITCDAGHKTVSADAGIPNCAVLGHPELVPQRPSEEHLPIGVQSGRAPKRGDILYLVPRHVCPTVNNFDHALLVHRGQITDVVAVTARGREISLEATSGRTLRERAAQ